MQPAATVLPRPERAQLRDLIQRRQQLITLRTGEINRSHQAESAMRVSHQRIRQALTDEIKRIEQAIRDTLKATAELAARVALLSKTPGLGTPSRSPCAANCRSWATTPDAPSAPWWAWRPWPMTAASTTANATSPVAVPCHALRSIRRCCRGCGTTRRSKPSTCA
jgi:hypothetical protein